MATLFTHYRFGVNSGTEADHGWHANEDTNPPVGTIQCDTTFLLRAGISRTRPATTLRRSSSTASTRRLRGHHHHLDARQGGKWHPHQRRDCTQRLTGQGTFQSNNDGQTEDGSSGGSVNDIASGGCSETEIAIQIVAAAVNHYDLIEFQLTGIHDEQRRAGRAGVEGSGRRRPEGTVAITGNAPASWPGRAAPRSSWPCC